MCGKIKEYYHDLIEQGLKLCPECNGMGVFGHISECCGWAIERGICTNPLCNEYADPQICDLCHGTCTVPYTEEDALNDAENECIGNKQMMEDN